MAGVSGVNGIDEETLYYQYLINHNSGKHDVKCIIR